MKTKRWVSSIAIAGAIMMGSVAAPGPAPAPAQAFDSVWSLCAGLYPHSAATRCIANHIKGTRASRAELRCYKAAGIAMLETVAGTLITTRDARIIAGVSAVSGVFACIKTFV